MSIKNLAELKTWPPKAADGGGRRPDIHGLTEAVGLIRTADGALAVIDYKLWNMKEWAERVASGTCPEERSGPANREYQRAARSIDSIAGGVSYKGLNLLDGSLSQSFGSENLRLGLGPGQPPGEDFICLKIEDLRASSPDGLQLGDLKIGPDGEELEADWPGRDILGRENSQLAMEALRLAMTKIDRLLSGIGSLEDRMENIVTRLMLEAENLPLDQRSPEEPDEGGPPLPEADNRLEP